MLLQEHEDHRVIFAKIRSCANVNLNFRDSDGKDVQRIKCPLTYLCIEVNSLYSKMSFDLTEEQIYVITLKKCQWHKLIQQLWIQSCLEQSSTENRVQLILVCVQSKLAPGASPGLKLKLNLLLVERWGEIMGRWSSLKSWVVSWVEN